MDSERWERVQALFHQALELPESERDTFLKTACVDDSTLHVDVSALLKEDSNSSSLLDRDVAHVADRILDQPVLSPAMLQQFGPYHIKKVIGEGGMGVVYLAEREDVGSVVAIKLLRDAWLSPARRERFTAEQRTLAQLNHPSIARLYDADVLPDGTPWFAMEYVEGVSLTDYCNQHACSIEQRLELVRAVCEAVQDAHRHAVIHRDLKPSNILVKLDGTVRLLDFGIAKQMETLGAPVDQTQTALRLMTPAYAAPEQLRGERTGIHTDVYALGVILYELLAGRLPFDLSSRTPGEAEAMILERDPEKPSAVAKRSEAASASQAAWADLDVLCLTAMHKDPQRRYGSVEALLRDIDHFLRAEPLEARPDSFRYRLDKFVRRNRRAVSVAAVVLAGVLGLVIFFTVRLAIARNVAEGEAARTQRIQQFMMKLFEGGDEAVGPNDELRVITLVDHGVQEAQTLSGEPEVQAELYLTLGGIYQKLGKLERADNLLQLSLDRRKKLFGNEHAEVAESLVALGLLRLDQARLPEAEQLVRSGLAMSKRTLPPDHPAIAKATASLGKVLVERGEYDQAAKVLDEAVRLWSARGAVSPELASSLYQLSVTHFYAGHYPVAESLDQRALAMHRRLFGDRYPLVSEDLSLLGNIQFQLGNYAKSEHFTRQALDITQSWYGKDHPQTAATLNLVGQSLVYERQFDEADTLLRRALAIRERVYGPVHPLVASTLNELGGLALQRKHWDEAEGIFRRMIGIDRAVYGDSNFKTGIAVSNLGSVYLDRMDYVHAEQNYREALRLLHQALPPGHLHIAIVEIKLGRTLLRQHRYAEAETHSREGYEILAKQASPSVTWLKNGKKDLIEEYTALKQPEKVALFQR